jgi:UDP-glucose 4-epimerase
MKYLVTGGAGFIGSNLTDELLKSDCEVIVVDDLSSGYEGNLESHPNLQLLKTKIQDTDSGCFKGINGIFHLAAQASVPISITDFYSSSLNNIDSSLKIFEYAKIYNVPVVYASSSAIYGNLPVGDDEKQIYEILSPYAQDKLTIEKYAKLFYDIYKINSIGLRFFNVYGPRQDPTSPYSGVISVFVDKFLNKLPVQINGGYQTRDFIYVKDVVNVLILSMNHLFKNSKADFINVGTGQSLSVKQLFDKLTALMNYEPEIIYNPLPDGEPEKSSGTFNKLNKILKFETSNIYNFEKGLTQTIEYIKGTINAKI